MEIFNVILLLHFTLFVIDIVISVYPGTFGHDDRSKIERCVIFSSLFSYLLHVFVNYPLFLTNNVFHISVSRILVAYRLPFSKFSSKDTYGPIQEAFPDAKLLAVRNKKTTR